MDVPAILQEAFEISEEDIFTTAGDKGLTFTVRLVNVGILKVFYPKQVKRPSGVLWSAEEPEPELEVSVNGQNHEMVRGRDELVAWISMVVDVNEPVAQTLAGWTPPKVHKWTVGMGRDLISHPHPAVLLRVMELRQWGLHGPHWGFAVNIKDKVIGHEDAGRDRGYERQLEAQQVAERIFDSAYRQGKLPDVNKPKPKPKKLPEVDAIDMILDDLMG
jgi:hypothetical protein